MASILETFYFLFDSDASKLDKGLTESERKSERLEKSLKETDKAADMVGGSLLGLAKSAGKVIGSFLAFQAIKATILDTANAIDDLADSAAALNLPVERLSAWSMAVTASDGSQEGFIGSLNTINAELNAIATKGTGRMLPFLKELGLSMADIKKGAKDPLAALVKMSDAFSKLTKAEAAGLGKKMGLDQGTINLLAQGRRGIEELLARQKELGVVTTAQAEAAAKFDLAMKEWNATFDDVKRKLVTDVLPVITDFIELMGDVVRWMSDNKAFVVTFFGAIATVVTAAYVPAMLRAAAATWLAIGPFLLMAAAVLLVSGIIALVADDLYNFMQGNDSVTGEIAKKWPAVGNAIRALGRDLAWSMAFVSAFGTLVVDTMSGNEDAVDTFAKSIRTLVDDISETFPSIGEIFERETAAWTRDFEAIGRVWDWLIGKVSAGIEIFAKGFDTVRGILSATAGTLGFDATVTVAPAPAAGASALQAPRRAGRQPRTPAPARPPRAMFMDDTTATAVGAGRQHIEAARSPLAAQTSNSISNSNARTSSKSSTVNTGPITVNTQATDGAQVASALGQELGSQMRGAIDQNDDGVLA